MAVSVDRGTPEKVKGLVRDYVKAHKVTFLNLLDPESASAAQYGVRALPMNFFINSRGKVVAFASGYREWASEDGKKMIERLLSETP